MTIDLNNPKHVIAIGLVLLFLYWSWTSQGRLEERCEQQGGEVVTVGYGEDSESVCRFGSGDELRLSDLD